MDTKGLLGIAVVSVTEAARLGAVTDVLFAAAPLRVAALKAAASGDEFVIPFERVSKFGTDAVMVDTPEATQMSTAGGTFAELAGWEQLQKLKIVDADGTFVGTIQKVDFDPETGNVVRLVARKGGVLGAGGTTTTVDGGEIRSVGSEVLTIAASPQAQE